MEEPRIILDSTYAYASAPQPEENLPLAEKAARYMVHSAEALPFLSLPFAWDLGGKLQDHAAYLLSFRHMLVLGIGGSALGARALQKAFAPEQDRPGYDGSHLWIADNLDEEGFAALLEKLPVEETIVVVISKSGGTLETIAQYRAVLPWLKKELPGTWQEHLFMITDAQKGYLRDEVDSIFLRSLPVPDYMGGRYSVLSAVGLVPALFAGINWAALLDGACTFGRDLLLTAQKGGEALAAHPAWKLASWAAHWAQNGRNQLIDFTYDPKLSAFGPWFCQLWAESLGKEGKGSMPLAATGSTDQHSLLQMFLQGPADKACLFIGTKQGGDGYLRIGDEQPAPWEWLSGRPLSEIFRAEALATRMALVNSGMPLMYLEVPEATPWQAGKLIVLLEAVTLLTGWMLGIDPLDQPAVEEGKKLARAALGAPGSEEDAKKLAEFAARPRTLLEF